MPPLSLQRGGGRGYARVRHQAAESRGYAGLGGGSWRRSGRAWPRRRRGRIRGGLGPQWGRAQAPAPPLRIPRPPAAPRGAATTALGRGLCAARHRLCRASPGERRRRPRGRNRAPPPAPAAAAGEGAAARVGEPLRAAPRPPPLTSEPLPAAPAEEGGTD